jgi:hypothetical protein
MALINVSRVTFLKNDPFGGPWVTGDVVDTYWDSATLLFSVRVNGAGYPQGGAATIDLSYDYIPEFLGTTIQWSLLIPSYCVGTTQYSFDKFRQSTGNFIFSGGANDWPYCFSTETPNSNLCAVTPIVPDLAWSGIPSITHATNPTSNDGSLTYAATSSYSPIYYTLFAFFAGGALATPTVTGLAPGSYIWYAKDAKGFTIQYAFTINDMSAGLPQPPLVVPDIQFPGLPTMSQDTGSGNGSITFPATSSYPPIQYSLRDFLYGQGQASSTFNNLPANNYTLYAVDSKNCKASFTFTIPLNVAPSPQPAAPPTQQVVYQMQVPDFNGKIHTINFLQKGYPSQATQVDGGNDDPIIHMVRLEGEIDPYPTVAASQLSITLKSVTPYQFRSMISGAQTDNRVHYYRDGVLKLVTKIYPQSYREPYNEAGNYPVSFIATDGLVELDDLDFLDDYGARIAGVQKQVAIIALALAKLNFNLNIRVAANLYATGMNTTASDDPLDQAYVDAQSYYTNSDTLSCLEVIKRIVEPYNATICQWDGYWYIVRFEELIANTDYREFDVRGAYVSNGTLSGTYTNIKKSTDQSRLTWANYATGLDMLSPQGNIEVTYKQGLKSSLIRNGTFDIVSQTGYNQTKKQTVDLSGFTPANNGDTTFATSFTTIDGSQTNGALVINGNGLSYVMAKVPSMKMSGTDKLSITLKYKTEDYIVAYRYQRIKLRVQHGSYYLQQDGTWTTTASDIIHYETDFGKFKSFTITASQANTAVATGADLTVRIYSSYIFDGEFGQADTSVQIKAKSTTTLPPGYRTEWYTTIASVLGMYYFELEKNTSAESIPDIIRPNDYNAVTNPYQWIRKQNAYTNAGIKGYGILTVDESILKYIPSGAELVEDSVESTFPQNTRAVLKKTIYHGSVVQTFNSIFSFGINISTGLGEVSAQPIGNANPSITHLNFLRKSDGTPWIFWKRDAVAESERLQSIFLKALSAQYRNPRQRLTGQLSNRQINDSIAPVYITPIQLVKDNYDGKFYRPMGIAYHARQCYFDGDFVEMIDITAGGTSTSGGISSFNSTFNSTYGS